MTKLQGTRLAFALSLFSLALGCANHAPKENALDDGPLAAMSRKTHDRQESQEIKHLGDFVTQERKSARQKPLMHFPMPEIITEESIYQEVLRAYQIRDPQRMDFFCAEFVKRYPNSVFNDNAIYLNGQLKLALNQPSSALKEFETVIKNYPTGNKRAAALLGKAVAYRKLQLYQFAEKVFVELKKDYPGSPEFFKSELEEKLLRAERDSALKN